MQLDYPVLRRWSIWLLAAILLAAPVYLVQATSLQQSSSEGQAIFAQKCQACHTIGGGRLVGPDLQGVTQRRDLSWLKEFISAPDQMLASGDPIATQLLAEYNNVPMPNLALSPAEVEALIAYLENPAAGGAGNAPPSAAPAGPGDAARGQALFNGQIRLQNGGASCIACHSVAGLPTLGGGSLGPDLTQVVQRYGGEAGTASVLTSLPFPTMQGFFATRPLTPQEQADLLAYFIWAGAQPAPQQTTSPAAWFWAVGIGGALALFAGMALFWPRQRRSISEQLRSMG
ncbi:MAG: c-type cytochrome [Anaerolineales bacterium]|nr:c-type cytochrome [Anaerolineales bacterium]